MNPPFAGRIIDISVPVRPGMIVYEGDPDITLEPVASIAAGAVANVSRLNFGVHTGTHVDAPGHFIEGAAGVDESSLDALIGSAFVVNATSIEHDISAADLDGLVIPGGVERVLFKTRNSELWNLDEFSQGFIGLERSAARSLVERGVRLVGVDYLSVAPRVDPAPTHVTLLEAGIVILEGLDLRKVEPGSYTLVCLPLRLVGADGAPGRAILIADEGSR